MNNITSQEMKKVRKMYRKYCPGVDKSLDEHRKRELLLWNDFNELFRNSNKIRTMEEILILRNMRNSDYCEDDLRREIDILLIKDRVDDWHMFNPGKDFKEENIKEIA